MHASRADPAENGYLFSSGSAALNNATFRPPLEVYAPLGSIRNVASFARQTKAVQALAAAAQSVGIGQRERDNRLTMAVGHCLAITAYGQLVAEHARALSLAPEMISVVFHMLTIDLNAAAIDLKTLLPPALARRMGVRRLVAIPRTTQADWDFVARKMAGA